MSINDNDPYKDEYSRDDWLETWNGVKRTIYYLTEVNLGTNKDQRPTYFSAFLEDSEEISYINILK